MVAVSFQKTKENSDSRSFVILYTLNRATLQQFFYSTMQNTAGNPSFYFNGKLKVVRPIVLTISPLYSCIR
jgi:hypothetical protein